MKKKEWFADWLIELANRGFGMSTDAFLESVKKFLDKEVRIISVIFYVLCHNAWLYFWNRLRSAREAYKSLACRHVCTITLFLLCPDSGTTVWILGNIGALQKY